MLPPATDWIKASSRPSLLLYAATAILLALLFYTSWSSINHVRRMPPLINPPKMFDLTYSRSKMQSVTGTEDLMSDARKRFGDKPYSIVTLGGPVMVLPAKFAEEIRNDARLSFTKSAEQDFHAHLPAFRPFGGDITDRLAAVAKTHLTKLIAKTTIPLCDEAARTLEMKIGRSPDWQHLGLEELTLEITSRMAARVTSGQDLCRNETWLRNTIQYTIHAPVAANKLRLFPAPLRYLAHLALPECRAMRTELATARALVTAVVDKRRRERLDAASTGRPMPCYEDAIEWGAEQFQDSPGPSVKDYDPAMFQLQTSVVGLHSSTDLLTQTLINILLHPDIVPPLRREMVDAVGPEGWSKPCLHKLQLMDGVMKETQRLKPLEFITMHRVATSDVYLSDGTLIPKHAHTVVANTTRLDPSIYERPGDFDPFRWVRMRASDKQKHQAPMVSAGINSLGFGYGLHVCPGRFFATDLVKMALCHLMLKYDIELDQELNPKPYVPMGFFLGHDREVRIKIRKRAEEISIDV
ncbi:cytochrome P450 [Colletotrichum navitas]|uniref:Cytochrome P450 n=1 Tax=Colletotrichum navitas TaxID=681940 RepID=A0AAD8PXD5_9PEZI|nr:cytochrome P450 [Colletotrichum navitas]KAK1589820.1 cytochrome P450 [Colletotrichum navitas]